MFLVICLWLLLYCLCLFCCLGCCGCYYFVVGDFGAFLGFW